MYQNPSRRRKPKMPDSVTAPSWALEELKRALNRAMESDVPGVLRDRWNVDLRSQKHGVAVPFPISYQGKAYVQVGPEAGLYEDSGDVVLPLVAYVVAGGSSYNVPLDNAKLYVKWEPIGSERSNIGKARHHIVVTEIATTRPNLDAALARLRAQVQDKYTPNTPGRHRPPPPPPRRAGTSQPAPPRGGPASVLSSVRRIVSGYSEGFEPTRYQPHGVKPHHFAVNPSSKKNASQQFVQHLVSNLEKDEEVLAELYVQEPDPASSIMSHLNYWVNEALEVGDDSGSPSDLVCMIGRQMISKPEVNKELQERLPELLELGRQAAEVQWPGDPAIAEATAKLGRHGSSKPRGRKAAAAAAQPRSRAKAAVAPASRVDTRDVPTRVLAAFDQINAEQGRRNYVKLYDMRQTLPDVSRSDFDRAINDLRRRWVLTLDPAEGRHERLPAEVLDAGIYDQQTLLVYAARREEDEDARPPAPASDLPTMIEQAALRLGGGQPKQRIRITELRERIPASVSKEEFERTLLEMQSQGRLVLYRNDNPREIKPADERDAVYVAGYPRHILYLED